MGLVNDAIVSVEEKLHGALVRHGITALRVSVGAVFLGFGILNVALIRVTRATRVELFVLLVVVSFFFYLSAVRLLLRALRRPKDSTAEGRARGKKTGMWFGIIFGLEGMIIGITSSVLAATHQGELIVPIAILVVGLHFLPLARLFDVSAYYALGIAVAAVTVGTLAFVPSSATIAGIAAWTLVPGDAFILLTWLTVAYLLIRAGRALDARGAGEPA